MAKCNQLTLPVFLKVKTTHKENSRMSAAVEFDTEQVIIEAERFSANSRWVQLLVVMMMIMTMMMVLLAESTLCLKKVPIFKLSVTCQILTDFQNVCTAGKSIKLCTKDIQHYPSRLRHVAALPWEIKNSNFLQIFSIYGRKCKQLHFEKLSTFEVRLSTYLLCISSNTNFLSKSCPRRLVPRWLLTNTAVRSAVTNFRCTKLKNLNKMSFYVAFD